MKTNEQMEKQASRIADAIVDLVECNNGPVTFAQIEREVEGFAANGPEGCTYALVEKPEQPIVVVWAEMTEAGATALRQVMCERRVAVQFVTPVLYLGRTLKHEKWVPMVLLPVRAANLNGPRWHIRAPETYLDQVSTNPYLKESFRFLTPGPVHSTADQYSI
jgi:hypothetical protein